MNKLGVEIIVDKVPDKEQNELILSAGKKLTYGKLVLATGFKTNVPQMEVMKKKGVFCKKE